MSDEDLVPLRAPPGVDLRDWGERLYEIGFFDLRPIVNDRWKTAAIVTPRIAALADDPTAVAFIMSLGDEDIREARRDPYFFKARLAWVLACVGATPGLAERIETAIRLGGVGSAVLLVEQEARDAEADVRDYEVLGPALGLGWSEDVRPLAHLDTERGTTLVPFWVNLLGELVFDVVDTVREPGRVYSYKDYEALEERAAIVERDMRMRLAALIKVAAADPAVARMIDATARLGGKAALRDLIPVLDGDGPL